MSKSMHTPGPWEDAEYPVVFAPYPKDSAAMVKVANCMVDRDIFDQWQANARLIAAAPELLEALIYLRDCIESGAEPAMSRVNAAIAKAEGRANA